MNKIIPAAVLSWVESHKGHRTPQHTPGAFQEYAQSKTAACWGQPLGGISIPGYKIAVCQPSPQSKGETAWLWYDFEQIPQ